MLEYLLNIVVVVYIYTYLQFLLHITQQLHSADLGSTALPQHRPARTWRDAVRSGGAGTKYASRGNLNRFYEYTY